MLVLLDGSFTEYIHGWILRCTRALGAMERCSMGPGSHPAIHHGLSWGVCWMACWPG